MKWYNCPGPGCDQRVIVRLFACHHHWLELSVPARQAIYDTAKLGLLHPDRRAAIDAAQAEWAA